MDPDPPIEQRPQPAALQLELPSAMPARAAADAEPAQRESLPALARRRAGPIAGVVACLAIAGILAVEILVPRYVRRACIDEAAAHGIALAIDDVRVTRSGFVLKGVRASAADLPGASVAAPEVAVETRDLKPEKLTANGMEVVVSGRWSSVSAALSRWRASEQGGQGGAWAPASLVIDDSRIVWRGPVGDQANVEAAGVHLDVAWSGRDPAIHATSSNVTVTVPGGTLGPWRADLDRETGVSRVRVALDPGVPDACTVLVVGNDQGIASADVAVPRSPIARLGIAPALLGLHGELQLATALHYAPFGARSNATATAKGGLYGVAVEGISQPIDVSWDGTATGQNGVIDVNGAHIGVGPLVGAARGTLKTYDDGFRIDLAWNAGPVPCAAFDTPLVAGQPPDRAYPLRKLARSAGLTPLRGEVSASAVLAFDSRDLGATTLTFAPKADCKVPLGL